MNIQQFIDTYDLALNKQQQEAVQRVDGPTLLLAVPGSGKTSVIVARAGYMISQGIAPGQMLTLTFSKAAATDMERRFIRSFPGFDRPNFRTIHSFCYQLLRRYYNQIERPLPRVISSTQQMLRGLLPGYPRDAYVQEVATAVGYAKNNMLTEDELDQIKIEDLPSFRELYYEYEQAKKDSFQMDYDDMLMGAWQLLKKDERLLYSCQNQYRYISVDEAQDTSRIQHDIIQMLASRHQNIFMVGDEDQSIYAFRAAYPEALLTFDQQYKNAKVLYMEQNYRSTPQIIHHANRFIVQNKHRHEKQMTTENTKGAEPEFVVLPTLHSQYDYIKKVVRKTKKEESLALIYRNNMLAIPLMEMLDAEGFAYSIREDSTTVQEFLDSPPVQDMVSLLMLAEHPRSFEHFEQIYYKLGFYLSKENDLPRVWRDMQQKPHDSIAGVVSRMAEERYGDIKEKMKAFPRVMERAGKVPPAKAIHMLVDDLGYKEWMQKTKKEGGGSVYTQMEKIHILRLLAEQYQTHRQLTDRLHAMRGHTLASRGSANITCTTMHSSKGLEFDRVIITDAVTGTVPAEQNDSVMGEESQWEEEVRLFYVAMTRARSRLSVLSYKKAFEDTMIPSVFVQQLRGKLPMRSQAKANTANLGVGGAVTQPKRALCHTFAKGDRVRHRSFGVGTIRCVTKTDVHVEFSTASKVLDLQTCVENDLLQKMNKQ